MSYSSPFPGREWEMTAKCFSSGELKFDPAFIFRTFPMSEVSEAFALYKNPKQVHGKIMLINDQN
jgi:L-iditol 2-dehydrogenase